MPNFQRVILVVLASLAMIYSLAVLWYVPTQPRPGFSVLLADSPPDPVGVRLLRIDTECDGNVPDPGDLLVEMAGMRIRSYADYAQAIARLRSMKLQTGAGLYLSNDLSEDIPIDSTLSAIEYPNHQRWIRIWFLRPGSTVPLFGWVPLKSEAGFGVSLSMISFVLQALILLVAGLAYWNRPNDQPVRTFFALSAVAMIAFAGGNHWWLMAGNPWLIVPFAASGVMLPAVLLHFAVVCPSPKPPYLRFPILTRIAIYAVPAVTAAVVAGLILALNVIVRTPADGPFAATVNRAASDVASVLMAPLQQVVYFSLALSMVYFVLTLLTLIWGARHARNVLERNQIRPILWAAALAAVPVAYTCYLALFDHVHFALGGARLPMFLANLAFMTAYAIGVARYKLMLIDQVVSRGVWYYICSSAVTVVFSSLVAVGCVHALQQDLSVFSQTVPIIGVLMLSILVFVWLRDAVQRALDRRFFREKYQLDRALQRMNRVVTNVLEPEAVAESLLASCCEVLRVEHAVLYLRRTERPLFRLASAVGPHESPLQITLDDEVMQLLNQDLLLQRIPSGNSPAQLLLRRTGAEVLYGLEEQGQLSGIVALGPKPNGAAYSAEDVAFVTAMGRIAAVALHCVRVQEDVSRLNEDLRLKIDKIADQNRQIAALQKELVSLSPPGVAEREPGEFRRDIIRGEGKAIVQVLETVRKVAPSHSSVLLRGESGTGKELLARVIHQNSPRAQSPLIVAHCAAMSPTLLESELFGHMKGAFTDAREDRQGRFAMANGGTLFLDEIGDISLDVQVKLLRVIQEKTFEPVGSNRTLTADVRIIAATHRNLEQLIADGRFREDLFYRLNVISITLPPLRERKEDLHQLALHFLRIASEKTSRTVLQIEEKAYEAMSRYSWPGNVRELQNVIERAVVLTETDHIRLQDLPPEIRSGDGTSNLPLASKSVPSPVVSKQLTLRRTTVATPDDERQMLLLELERHGGNKTEAARALKMPRSTFFSKLKKHGLA